MKKKYELQAGIFITVCLLLFVLGIWLLGQERHIFTRQVEYFTVFKDIRGLTEGAPVRLGGITIGRVAKIEFTQNIKKPEIMVSFLINTGQVERMREDNRTVIQTQGLLGDKYLVITTGTADVKLKPGSLVKSKETGDMAEVLEKAGVVVDNTVKISENINTFLEKFSTDTLDDVSTSVTSLSKVLKEIEQGQGLAHRLIYSAEDGDKIVDNLENFSSDLHSITSEVTEGKGLLNALIYDDSGKETIAALTAASSNLATTAEHISDLATRVKTGNGLLHDLIYAESPEGLEDVIAKLNQTADNLQKTSEALSMGSGTLGALLVDAQLYDNLVEVTDGAKRSFILRQAIRSSMEE